MSVNRRGREKVTEVMRRKHRLQHSPSSRQCLGMANTAVRSRRGQCRAVSAPPHSHKVRLGAPRGVRLKRGAAAFLPRVCLGSASGLQVCLSYAECERQRCASSRRTHENLRHDASRASVGCMLPAAMYNSSRLYVVSLSRGGGRGLGRGGPGPARQR